MSSYRSPSSIGKESHYHLSKLLCELSCVNDWRKFQRLTNSQPFSFNATPKTLISSTGILKLKKDFQIKSKSKIHIPIPCGFDYRRCRKWSLKWSQFACSTLLSLHTILKLWFWSKHFFNSFWTLFLEILFNFFLIPPLSSAEKYSSQY